MSQSIAKSYHMSFKILLVSSSSLVSAEPLLYIIMYKSLFYLYDRFKAQLLYLFYIWKNWYIKKSVDLTWFSTVRIRNKPGWFHYGTQSIIPLFCSPNLWFLVWQQNATFRTCPGFMDAGWTKGMSWNHMVLPLPLCSIHVVSQFSNVYVGGIFVHYLHPPHFLAFLFFTVYFKMLTL